MCNFDFTNFFLNFRSSTPQSDTDESDDDEDDDVSDHDLTPCNICLHFFAVYLQFRFLVPKVLFGTFQMCKNWLLAAIEMSKKVF